jgi:hypothetical protein
MTFKLRLGVMMLLAAFSGSCGDDAPSASDDDGNGDDDGGDSDNGKKLDAGKHDGSVKPDPHDASVHNTDAGDASTSKGMDAATGNPGKDGGKEPGKDAGKDASAAACSVTTCSSDLDCLPNILGCGLVKCGSSKACE